MRNLHLCNMLALHVPNLLPKSVKIFSPHNGHWSWHSSHFPRFAGRLIWSSIMFIGGLAIVMYKMRQPKRSAEPATWVQTILGAMFVWVMMTLGYAVIPHEWLIFGNSYLAFDTATFVVKHGQWGGGLPPFDVTRAVVVDSVVAVIYIVVLVLNVYLFAAWQKRKVAEPATDAEAEAVPSASPFARFRRREKRVSAYGRPVTTSES
jgi:hypothetical protein